MTSLITTERLMVKHGASVRGLRSEALLALLVASLIYAEYGKPCVLTEGTGGRHGKHSHHLKGLAIDLRIRDPEGLWALTEHEVLEIVDKLRVRLGPEYQVVAEPDHLHIEFDPE